MKKPYRRVQLARLTSTKKGKIRIEANIDDAGNMTTSSIGSAVDIAKMLYAWATKSDVMRNAIFRTNHALIQKEIEQRREELYLEKCRHIINHHKPHGH